MSKIDWKRKLTSRKFWVAVAGFVTSVMVAFGADESVVTKVVAIISSCGIVCAYLFAESKVDAEGGGSND